jgi:hypothetical protein
MHGIITQKTAQWISNAVRIPNLLQHILSEVFLHPIINLYSDNREEYIYFRKVVGSRTNKVS